MCFRIGYPQSIRRLVQTTALGVLSGIMVTLPVRSADKLYFDYGVLGRQVSVSSLETFATDGTIDDELAPYLNQISPENRQEFQRILSTPLVALNDGIPEQIADPFVLSQWLYSPIGELVLATAGQLIQTEGRQNGQQAIRAAMVLAAADPAGLSLINVLRFYPTNGIRLDLPQILALSEAIETNIETTDSLVQATIQQSVAVAATEPRLDYQALPMLADVPRFDVVKQSLLLEDRDRNRTYPTDLYLPADLSAVSGPLPVMVFSHGYGDTRTNPESVAAARSLAANGFVVAVPEHIGSNTAYQDDLALGLSRESFDVMEFINRPLDIRFLLDTLEEKNKTDFQGRLQLDRVGLAGYSFGGYTVLATAGATIDVALLEEQCDLEADFVPDNVNIALLIQCRLLELKAAPQILQQLTDGSLADDRIASVFALSPLSNLFGEKGMGNIQMPVVIVGGAYDIATPIVQEQLAAFQRLTTAEKYFYLAENLSHTSALTRAVLDLAYPRSGIVDSFNASEQWLFNLMVTLLIAHAQVALMGDETYNPYLTAAYVESVSVDPTRLHLLRSLPPCLSERRCAEN
ncbi:alpha/beta hydrolase [Leptolyngbya sp. Heron Island J]|uniref:alpha/beta hydrolase n=1 Tax=Leptolyngbya sp. Heron Island J TaxID=1385935 RepID=UPI0004CF7CBD|nr:alpha/beta hydrolase [Leptolyngbya sp. Heron Island J]